jgi:hypothetical protein
MFHVCSRGCGPVVLGFSNRQAFFSPSIVEFKGLPVGQRSINLPIQVGITDALEKRVLILRCSKFHSSEAVAPNQYHVAAQACRTRGEGQSRMSSFLLVGRESIKYLSNEYDYDLHALDPQVCNLECFRHRFSSVKMLSEFQIRGIPLGVTASSNI